MSAIAKLIAGIGLNTSEFKKGIGEVQGQTGLAAEGFSKLKSAIAGAFTVGAITAFVGKMKAYADATKDLADQTGATSEAVQALTVAGIDNAASQQKLTAGLQKIRAAQVDALDGNVQMRVAFERLGISMEQIERVGADRVFELIGQSINGAENQTTALAAAGDILGTKLISSLTPALKAVGAEGLDPLIARMKSAGNIMDESMIVRIKRASDSWERFKNQILVYASYIYSAIEALGGAFGSALSTDPNDTFIRGWREMRLLQAEADRKALEAARGTNAGIVQSEEEKVEAVSEEAQKLEAEKIRAAKDAAAAEIAAAKKSAQEQAKYAQDLGKAKSDYFKAVADARWQALSAEEQLHELEKEREGILAGIRTAEAEMTSEQLQNSQYYYLLKTKEWALTGDIEQRTRALSDARKDDNADAKKFTTEQVTALGSLRDMLKGMTDVELDKFIAAIAKLHKGIGALDFKGLMGLAALQGFKIPNESVQNAEQFGKALNIMAGAMGNLTLPDLEPLNVLKGFSIPNESVMNARQFGSAIAEMVKALNNTPLDLAPLEKLADLFAGLKGGTIQLEIAAPSRDAMTLTIPNGFDTRLASIDGHLATLASLKGVIYQ